MYQQILLAEAMIKRNNLLPMCVTKKLGDFYLFGIISLSVITYFRRKITHNKLERVLGKKNHAKLIWGLEKNTLQHET